ncbi:MAG: hypothetical protein KQA33_00270 [Candidatus Aenigmarchaeota archaeon]|nr:hypothetical protein [Candidatus Aenigmarchaeota archaeon]
MQKDILWKAGILAAIVFIAGLSLGIWLDEQRVAATRSRLMDIDLQWNDARLTSLYYQLHASMDSRFCDSAIKNNFEFNDRIYKEGLLIERYEAVDRFAPELVQEKRHYALLQLQFWLNSIALKESCNASYQTLVYFYSHYDESLMAIQKAQSAVLAEIKETCGPQLLLIPIPLDMNIGTVSLVAAEYNVTSAPSILLNDKVLVGLRTKEELQQLINCSS